MKITQFIKSIATSTAVMASLGLMLFGGQAAAIPYTGTTTPALDHPGFNVYTGLGSNNGGVINEPTDFFQAKQTGTPGYSGDVSNACSNGTKFDLRVYVHNGASTSLNDNGNGTGVARNTRVSVNLANSQKASTYPMTSTISASNAGSVTDGLTINCNGHVVNLKYINGSANQYTIPGGTQALSDSIVTSQGAPIGTVKPDGNVWGCWDQRVWVTLQVEVTTPAVPASNGQCKVVDMTTGDNRTATITVHGQTTNATVVGYKIDWGDGTTPSNKQTDTHTYAKDGTYTIVSSVQVKLANGQTVWLTADACTKHVTFESGVPVTPPTTLVNTGPGSLAGIFAAVSLAGAMAYRVFISRRLAR